MERFSRKESGGTVYKPELGRFAETAEPERYLAQWCQSLLEQTPLRHDVYVMRYQGIWYRLDLEDTESTANMHILIMKPPADNWPYRYPDTLTQCAGRMNLDGIDAATLCQRLVETLEADPRGQPETESCQACTRLNKDPNVTRAFAAI